MGHAWTFWYSLQDRMGLFNLLFPILSALCGGGGMTVSVQKWMVTLTTFKPISHTEFPLNKKVYFDHIDTYVNVCTYMHTYLYITNPKNIFMLLRFACGSCYLSAVSYFEFFLVGAFKSEQGMRCDYIIP